MALPSLGVAMTPANQEEIRDAILADYRFEALKTAGVDPAVQPGTDTWWWATSHAAVSMLQFSNIAVSRSSLTPLDATGEDLDAWRRALGLPEVKPSPSTGKIVVSVTGTQSLADGEPLVLPNGLRLAVVGPWIGVVDGDEIDVQAVDTGTATNLSGGAEVRFVAAPTNISQTAKVSRGSPLTGGSDVENDDRKRVRVLNAAANKPGGGNWADMRETAFEALQSVQDCAVYPALGGPASVKVVPYRDLDPDNAEFTRELSTAAINIVKNAIYAKNPDGIEIVVTAAADLPVDAALTLTIPSSSLSGGSGQGWADQDPWPPLSGDTEVTVLAVPNSTVIVVSALTTTSAIAGQTRVAWWSPVDRRFRQFLVVSVSGSAGNWSLGLDRPAVSDDGSIIAFGDYISPGAVNLEAYGKNWVAATRALGPGENTADVNRTPRALRHPYVADERPSSLTFLTLQAFRAPQPEISDIAWSSRSATTPAIPVSVDLPPNIFVPRHFGFYPA